MEKKPIAISMSGLVLIIAILVIAVMGVYIYMQDQNAKSEVAKVEEDKASLQNTVNELQGKITTISEITQNEVVKEENNNKSKELTNTEILQNIYPKNNGNLSMNFSYITITSKFNNNESEVEVIVNENNFRDSVGKVKLGQAASDSANRENKYRNLKEKVVDALIDVNSDGSISIITLLTADGKAYSTPWGYRYDSTQANLFEMGDNIVRLSYDANGGCGYDKNGNIVFHTNEIYKDGE